MNIIFLALVLALSSGCAKTVTERIPIAATMTVSVNFAGNLDFVNNKYFMVIGNNSDYQMPLSYPYEFIEPVLDTPLDQQVDYFQYYSTWAGYVTTDSGIIFLVPGPFESTTEANARIQVGEAVGEQTRLSFNFRLDQVFGDSPPDTIYFDFVSVDKTRYLKDHLHVTGAILKYEGMIASGSDEGSSDIDPSLDILDWAVSVQ
jgi:hypothetical protein